jgi:trimeric autotransporter adhesin
MTGAITTSSTFDGRDVATDGTKLDGIAAGATNYTDANVDTHLNTSTATSGEFLSWDGSDYDWTAAGAPLYAANESSPAAQPSATGANAVAIGDSAVAGGIDAFSFGVGASASGDYGIAIGRGTTASGYDSLALVNTSTASGSDSMAFGSNAVAGPGNFTLALGGDTDATGFASAAIGKDAQSVGSRSTAIGRAYAFGADSFAAAITDNTSSYGATGANSIAIGKLSKADDVSGVAIGESNIASGSQMSVSIGKGNNTSGMRSVAIGYNNTVSGLSAMALGSNMTSVSGNYSVAFNRDNDAPADYSFVSGYYADSHAVKGRFARGAAGANLATKGGAQYGLLVLTRNTEDATATPLTTNGNAPSSDNQLVVQNSGAVAFHGTIVAKQASSTNVAAWEVKGLMHNISTATLVNSAITVINNTPSWGLTMSADTTNDAVQFIVTGAASTNISWVATIHSSEVIRA